MKTMILLLCFVAACLLSQSAQAQAKPSAKLTPAKAAPARPAVAKPAPAATTVTAAVTKPANEPTPPALITEKMETPKSGSDMLKINAETNPITNRLAVRTDSPGPTRVEINDAQGHPVLTHDMISGNKTTALDVTRLPAGAYIIQCTSGTRSGTKRVLLGQ